MSDGSADERAKPPPIHPNLRGLIRQSYARPTEEEA